MLFEEALPKIRKGRLFGVISCNENNCYTEIKFDYNNLVTNDSLLHHAVAYGVTLGPRYVYQYALKFIKNGNYTQISGHKTEDEIKQYVSNGWAHSYAKIEESKQEMEE